MLKRNNEGYYFQTETREYSLLEGITIGGEKKYTSDMLFIVDDKDIDKPVQVVGVLFGAFQLDEDNKYREDYIDHIRSLIEKYEKENK